MKNKYVKYKIVNKTIKSKLLISMVWDLIAMYK